MFSKLPQEAVQNQVASKIQQILKQKKKKPSKTAASKTIDASSGSASMAMGGIGTVKHYNESITNALKTISRQGSQAGGNARGANLSPKKLIALRN